MCSRENEDLNNRGFVKQLISCVNACPIFEGQNENDTFVTFKSQSTTVL